jgi:D-alanine transaminase
LQFADSVYEVVAIYKKNLVDFEFHIKRLKYSLKELLINYKVEKNKLKNIFNKLINLNKINSGIIYLQITRGVQAREHVYNNKLKPNIIIYARHKKFNLPHNGFKGEKAVTCEDLRWKRRDIKTVNLLPNIIAANFASRHKAYEAILIQNNKITEGTSSNIWIVKNKKLFTHPSNTDILKGITRETLRILIKHSKLKLFEKSFTKKQLFNADEVFLTSSGSCVTPITKIDSKLINKGKIGHITLNLAKLYSKSFMNE